MTTEEEFGSILNSKAQTIQVFFESLQATHRDEQGLTPEGTRLRMSNGVARRKIAAYFEGMLFEMSSYFDILMKYLLGADNTAGGIHFNRGALASLQPNDALKQFLLDVYDNGTQNNPKHSLKKMKDYRNASGHATVLDLASDFLQQNYILPDDPNAPYDNWTYQERIMLFDFITEMERCFGDIAARINSERPYGRYTR